MKKKLTEQGFDNSPPGPIDFDDYINRFGYFQFEKNGNIHWVRYYEYEYEEYGRHYYNTKYLEPAIVEFFRNREEKTCLLGYPISIDGYNSFARWDLWKGGYVEHLGYVEEPVSSVDYGCSLYLNSWIRRGAAENPVHVFQFYELVNDYRWKGGEVDTWGTISESTRILGSSLAFEVVGTGENTIGSLINLNRRLGYNTLADSLRNSFIDYYDNIEKKYKIDDEALQNYINKTFYLYNVFGNNGLNSVKEALYKHRAVYVRIVTEIQDTGHPRIHYYGDDYLVIDYHWIKQTFVCINPITRVLYHISETDIIERNINTLFYIVDNK